MQFSLYVDFRVSPPDAYLALTAAGRSEARKAFFAAVDPLLGSLVSLETSDPAAALAAALADAGGGWSVGPPASLKSSYVYDPVTGRWICQRSFTLEKAGAAFVAETLVEGAALQATYRVGWSHEG